MARQRGTWGVVIQCVATEPPTLGALGLPAEVARVVEEGRGLVVVGGGRARASVLASLIRQYNQSCYGHLVSLEEPLHYLHADLRASVTQREIGHDLPDFRTGLVSAMRQDPDALVLSEVPDHGEAEARLRLAEEGVFVIAGLSTSDGQDPLRASFRRFPATRHDEVEGRVGPMLRGAILARRGQPAEWRTATEVVASGTATEAGA